MQEQSKLMDFFRFIGADATAWSLRRLHCPTPKDALVLELGSGGRPHYISNVLCDAFMSDQQRNGLKLITDRPSVLGFAEKLPFKDDSFDYVIASYIFEHTTDPDAFLSEIQRVAKAGFIEVPMGIRERFTNVPVHTLEISKNEGTLYITKKKGPAHDPSFRQLLNPKIETLIERSMQKNPFSFQLRYYWSRDTGGIKYKILNSDYEFDWEAPLEGCDGYNNHSLKARLKTKCLQELNKRFAPTRKVDLFNLLMCIHCKSEQLIQNSDSLACQDCSATFPLLPNGAPNFTEVPAKALEK
ncbi:MAG: class I SAM-dependent methyltransferase, partial [Myxococcota bacterium]|nr:class I SAM-dependent methyltransferase [Myxococcota bacterium]